MGENKFKNAIQPSAQDRQEPEEIMSVQTEEDRTSESEPETEKEEPSKKKRTKKKSKGNVMTILGGRFLVKEKFYKMFPLVVYVTILLMVIITNTYIAEEKNRELTKVSRRLNDLQVEHSQLQSSILEASKLSVLSKKLEGTGLRLATEPLKRIVFDNTTIETEKP